MENGCQTLLRQRARSGAPADDGQQRCAIFSLATVFSSQAPSIRRDRSDADTPREGNAHATIYRRPT